MSNSHLHFLFHDHYCPKGLSNACFFLASGLFKRGHKITIFSENKPNKDILKLGLDVKKYHFTDKNSKLQTLRSQIKGLAPDVCCSFASGSRQLVWAVTLLGSGIPLVLFQNKTPGPENLVALSGADCIIFLNANDILMLPKFLRPLSYILPDPNLMKDEILDSWESILSKTAESKGHTIMDGFSKEPFTSTYRLYAASQREWLWRDFGSPIPGSFEDRMLSIRNTVFKSSIIKSIYISINNIKRISLRSLTLVTSCIYHFPFTLCTNSLDYNYYLFKQLLRTITRKKYGYNKRATYQFIDYICSTIKIDKTSVLCVGCREIRELNYWQQKGCANVTGIDLISTSDLVQVMDMHSMKFPDNCFDIIYSCHSLEHALHPQKAILEFIRVCKEGGYVAIEVPHKIKLDGVDLYDFPSFKFLRDLFTHHIKRIISEKKVVLFNEGRQAHRVIYQIAK